MRKVNRRDFIKRSAILAAGAYAGIANGSAIAGMMGGSGMGGGGMGGGTTIIDPPVGPYFKDPVELANTSTTSGVVEVSLDCRIAPVNVNGSMANLMTYNGYLPGPVIRAKKTDILRVHFKNSLPADGTVNLLGHLKYPTNLHTHGLHVSPSGISDNMMLQFKPGDPEFMYEYDLSKQEAGTLNFYHPHIHGCVADQMWAGMAGPLVIEDDSTMLSGYETHIFMLKDISLNGSDPAPYTSMMEYMQGKEGNIVMVNGQVNPRLSIRPGQVQRWRVVNASTARFYKLNLENHSMYLIGTEGGLVDRPYQISEIIVAPGERVDLLVKANQSVRSYKLRSLAYDRGMNQLQTVTLMTLTYTGSRGNDQIPSFINANAKRLILDTSMLPKKTMTLSMGQGKGYINGQTFIDHDHCYTAASNIGGYEVWEIINQSGMDHPFHHHVNPAQVLSITSGDTKYASLYTTIPAWKDVTIVPKWGKVTLLIPVMDYAGMAMIHCHIIEHEDTGMIGIWNILGDGMPM